MTTVQDPARTGKELDHSGSPSHQVYTAGFYSGDWDFSVRALLGKATRGGADIGEVLATIGQVKPKDVRGWFQAWLDLGDRITGIAQASAAGGHRVSAARAFLRAANYYATAVNALSATRRHRCPTIDLPITPGRLGRLPGQHPLAGRTH